MSIGTPVVFRQISSGGKESREPQFTSFIGTRTNTRNERCGNSHSANVPTGTPKYADNRRKWSRVKRRLPWITAESREGLAESQLDMAKLFIKKMKSPTSPSGD
ncbi:MAG: hypothetical protein NTZ32_27115 [Planctomycetales bacterium]|nr:hypothetical protein [Planctomycetales bacterium]